MECNNSGVADSSSSSCAGNRLERKEKEKRKWGSLMDERTVSQVLVQSLNPKMGGSNMRTLESTQKLQIL